MSNLQNQSGDEMNCACNLHMQEFTLKNYTQRHILTLSICGTHPILPFSHTFLEIYLRWIKAGGCGLTTGHLSRTDYQRWSIYGL